MDKYIDLEELVVDKAELIKEFLTLLPLDDEELEQYYLQQVSEVHGG